MIIQRSKGHTKECQYTCIYMYDNAIDYITSKGHAKISIVVYDIYIYTLSCTFTAYLHLVPHLPWYHLTLFLARVLVVFSLIMYVSIHLICVCACVCVCVCVCVRVH